MNCRCSLLKLLFLLFQFIFLSQISGANYYWVGNSGNWSDLSHWATSSGGSTFHIAIPGIGDDVYFDNQSFTVTNAQVGFNNEFAYVRDLHITSTNMPKFVATDTLNNLIIARNADFSGDFVWDFKGQLQLISSGGTNAMDFGKKTVARNLIIDGMATWNFTNGFHVSDGFIFKQGSISFGTDSISCAYFESMFSNPRNIVWNDCVFVITQSSRLLDYESYYWDLNKFTFRMQMFQVTSSAGAGNKIIFLGADSDMILIGSQNARLNFGSLEKRNTGGHFRIFDPTSQTVVGAPGSFVLNSSTTIQTGLDIGDMILSAGTIIDINPAQSILVKSIKMEGDCKGTVTMWSSVSGNAVNMQISQPLMGQYGIIRDIRNTGASMTIQNGADLGNNTGFNVIASPGKTFYWVGRNGLWSVASNWSLSSGGAPQTCIPTIQDNVVFDNNSFTAAGQKVSLDGPHVFCKSMTWTPDVRANTAITGNKDQRLIINGSLFFEPHIQNELKGEVHFVSPDPNNIIQSGGNRFFNNIFISNKSGSWVLADDMTVEEEVHLISGSLILDGQTLTTYWMITSGDEERTLDIERSKLLLRTFYPEDYYPSFRYSNDNFTLRASQSLVSIEVNRGEIVCALDQYPSKNPKNINFNEINFNAYGYFSMYIDNGNLHVNKMTMRAGGTTYLNADVSVDTLVYYTNNTYEFKKYNTNTGIGMLLKDLQIVAECEGIATLISEPYQESFYLKFDVTPQLERINSRYLEYKAPGLVTAVTSIDGGFNKNISFDGAQGRKLFFVFSDGNWSDRANWSLSSGGMGGECIPTILDTVIFDSNSFSSLNAPVVNNFTDFANCHDLYFDVPGYVGYFGLYKLRLHGDMTFVQNIQMTSIELYVEGNEKQFLDLRGNEVNSMFVQSLDTVELRSTMNCFWGMYFKYGTFLFNNFSTRSAFHSARPEAANKLFIHYGSGEHTLTYDFSGGAAAEYTQYTVLDPGTSEINVAGANGSVLLNEKIRLNNIRFSSPVGTNQFYYYDDASFEANKVVFGSNATTVSYYLADSLFVTDSLIFTAGKTYNFEPDIHYRVNKYFRSIGNNCNGINFNTSEGGKLAKLYMNDQAELLMNFTQLNGIAALGGNAFNAGAFSVNVNNSSTGWFFPDRNAVDENIGVLGKDLFVCEGDEVILEVNTNSPGETYLWNDNSTASELRPVNSGKYSVVIKYQNNCEVKDTVSIVFSEIPEFDLGEDRSICQGSEISMNIQVVADSLKWQDGTFGGVYEIEEAGQYSLTAYNQGCLFSDTFNLTVLEITTFDFGEDTLLCGDATLELSIKIQEGESLVWSDMSSDTSLLINTTGTYYALIDNGQCTFSDTIEVNYLSDPGQFLGQDLSFCDGNLVFIKANLSGAVINWSDGTSRDSIQAQKSGVFWARVEIGSCVFRDTIIVDVQALPSAALSGGTTLCEGSSLSLSAAASNEIINWSDAGQVNPRIITLPGKYFYEASLGNCVKSDSIVIVQVSSQDVDLGSDLSLCAGESKLLDAGTDGETYLWSTGATSKEINTSMSGDYSVTVSKQGCSKSDTIVLDFKALPDPNIASVFPLCVGEEVQISVPQVDIDSLRWQDGDTQPVKTFDTEGLVLLTSYKNGCQAVKEITISKVELGASVQETSFRLCPGSVADLIVENPGKHGVAWSNGRQGDAIQVDQGGLYLATVTDQGCSESFEFTVEEVTCTRLEMFFPNIMSLSSFDNQQFRFQSNDGVSITEFDLMIFDRFGNLVFNSKDPSQYWDGRSNGQTVTPGVYTYALKMIYSDDYVENDEKSWKGTLTVLP